MTALTRARAAIEAGRFNDEITPIVLPQKKGEPKVFAQDEQPRPDTTTENGRRIATVHIDGDGFPSRAEVRGSPYAGKDLNGDGDTLDRVTMLAPSQTQTHRIGVMVRETRTGWWTWAVATSLPGGRYGIAMNRPSGARRYKSVRSEAEAWEYLTGWARTTRGFAFGTTNRPDFLRDAGIAVMQDALRTGPRGPHNP